MCDLDRVPGVRAGRHLWRPLGAAQTRLVWRLIGWAMLLAVLRARGGQPLAIDPSVVPWAYHALALAAGSLVLFGPRLILLIAAAGSWIWVLIYIVGGSDPKYSFIADEFLLFAALPVLGALSAGFTLVEQRDAAAQERDEAVDRGQLWQLRMCTLAALIGCTGGPTRGGRIWCSRRPSGLRRRSAAHAAVSGRALGVAASGLRALAAGQRVSGAGRAGRGSR